MLRVSLHPDGMAPRIATSPSGGATCSTACGARSPRPPIRGSRELLGELEGYPAPRGSAPARRRRARSPSRSCSATTAGELSFFSTVATFGTAVDVTVAELSIEAFFPADAETAAFLHQSLPQT